MRRVVSILTLSTSAMLAGCQTGPASDRGFFSGIGAAVSGEDERQASALEAEAAAREDRARQMQARATQADRQAQASSAQVRAAQQRLAALNSDIQWQQSRLNAVRTNANASEVNRLQSELSVLDRDQRAAASSGAISPATLQSLEERARTLKSSLSKIGGV